MAKQELEIFNAQDGKGTITYLNGNIYEGYTLNGKKNGYGEMRYADGRIYKGEWQNDKKNGDGEMEYPDGRIYEGGWQNDKKNGYGKEVYLNGTVYKGGWINSKKHGRGVETNKYGSCCEANWVNNKKHGEGTTTQINGVVFIANYFNDEIQGDIEIRYPSGDVYKGNILKGKKHGHGILKLIDGDLLEGEWDNDKLNKGKITHKNGNIYEGSLNGYKKDKGKLTLTNGDVIEGTWNDNEFKGNILYKNGDKYDGECMLYKKVDGCTDYEKSKGKLTLANGDLMKGVWWCNNVGFAEFVMPTNNDNFIGNIFYKNGNKYDGKCTGDGRTYEKSKGTLTLANGDLMEGVWCNGGNDFTGNIFYKNGNKYDGKCTIYKTEDGGTDYQRYGKGNLTLANGDLYIGEWDTATKKFQYDKIKRTNGNIYKCNPFSKETISMETPQGIKYEGKWNSEGTFEEGKILHPNGNVYEGKCVDDKLTLHKMTDLAGNIYEGKFLDGNLITGTIKYKNGDMYEGECFNDKKDGWGTLFTKNAKMINGFWKKDIPVNYILEHSNLKTKTEYFINKVSTTKAKYGDYLQQHSQIALKPNEEEEVKQNINLQNLANNVPCGSNLNNTSGEELSLLDIKKTPTGTKNGHDKTGNDKKDKKCKDICNIF